LHDLTNCLRIGDVTVFSNEDESYETLEIKSDPQRRRSTQNRRIRAAQDAVRNGGPLSGADRRARLYDLDIPFRTHLDLLRTGLGRAASDGIFAARVPGARALIVADMYGCTKQGWIDDDYIERLGRKLTTVQRRAGIGTDHELLVTATSLDSVSRDPQRVPFAAYPLDPVTCARLIGDLAVFSVETSGPALTEVLRAVGLQARWVRPPGTSNLAPGEVIMELSATLVGPVLRNVRIDLSRTLQVRRSSLDRYLIEMVDLGIWAEGTRHLLADHQTDRRPWTTFRDENQTWV
jgi:hypothetical protein